MSHPGVLDSLSAVWEPGAVEYMGRRNKKVVPFFERVCIELSMVKPGSKAHAAPVMMS